MHCPRAPGNSILTTGEWGVRSCFWWIKGDVGRGLHLICLGDGTSRAAVGKVGWNRFLQYRWLQRGQNPHRMKRRELKPLSKALCCGWKGIPLATALVIIITMINCSCTDDNNYNISYICQRTIYMPRTLLKWALQSWELWSNVGVSVLIFLEVKTMVKRY